MEVDAAPPDTITFRKKQYNYHSKFDKKHAAVDEVESLHAQGVKTHMLLWNTLYYVVYTLEKRK
jgi:hypothetical protein